MYETEKPLFTFKNIFVPRKAYMTLSKLFFLSNMNEFLPQKPWKSFQHFHLYLNQSKTFLDDVVLRNDDIFGPIIDLARRLSCPHKACDIIEFMFEALTVSNDVRYICSLHIASKSVNELKSQACYQDSDCTSIHNNNNNSNHNVFVNEGSSRPK